MPATFTDIPGVLSAQFTMSHGVTPSSGTIECVVPEQFPDVGTLEISDGELGVRLVDCKLAAVSYRSGRQGRTAVVQIIDRRWRWQFRQITGVYNARTASGAVDPETTKTARELATILLKALGETADVSALPDEGKPEVDWNAENAARALEDLCEQYNCRVVLGADNRVRIVKYNDGADLPDGPQDSRSGGVTPDLKPDRIVLLGGPWRFEVLLPLEAVGLETDFSIKPLNTLSYRPANGWGTESPDMASIGENSFVTADGSRTSPRELAQQSVFRWYRIAETATVPGLRDAIQRWRDAFATAGTTAPVDDVKRWQLLPLSDTLTQTYRDADKVEREKPAFAVGEFWHASRLEATNSKPGTKCDLPFSTDSTRGMIQFGSQVVLLDPQDGSQSEAAIRLFTAATCKDPDTRQPVRYVRSRQLRDTKGQKPLIAVIRHDEIFGVVTASYTVDGDLEAYDATTEDADKQADYYLDATEKSYDVPTSQQARYIGVQPIEPDGRIVQVTWETGTDGTFTTASRSTEHNFNVPSYAERRAIDKLSPKQQGFRDKLIAAAKKLFGGAGR